MKNTSLVLFRILLLLLFTTKVSGQDFHATENMPLIENISAGKSNFYIILLSGNGGWRDLDKSLTAYLVSKNISVLKKNRNRLLLTLKR
jgi:type IV secretory pathway VirJ component